MHRVSLQSTQLPQRDRESPNGESKDYDGGPGAHPGKKCPFVGKMIPRPIGIGLKVEIGFVDHTSMTPALFHSLGDKRARTRQIRG